MNPPAFMTLRKKDHSLTCQSRVFLREVRKAFIIFLLGGLGLGESRADTAYFVVRWLIGYVRTNTFLPFAWYRIGRVS